MVEYNTGAVCVNTPAMGDFTGVVLMAPDTRGKRLAYARLRTAQRLGLASLSAAEMSARLAKERGVSLSSNAYGRWESETRTPDAEWTVVVGRLSGLDPGWITFSDASAAPEPEGYRAWLAVQEGMGQPSEPLELEPVDEVKEGAAPKRRRGKGA